MIGLNWLKRAGAAALAAGCVAAPASAQLAQNSKAPVDLTADELEVVNADCAAIWRGQAEALQENSRLRADVLRIYNKKGPAKAGATTPSCGDVARIEADGNVYYATPDRRVRGDTAVYDADQETIVFTGDVVAAQGKNVLRGGRLVVHVNTSSAEMQTTARGGRGAPGRVRGVFYPKEKTQAAQ